MGCEPLPVLAAAGGDARDRRHAKGLGRPAKTRTSTLSCNSRRRFGPRLGEEFGMEPGTLVTGKLYAGLRRLGFNQVWDTNFSADLTIMEEGHELIHRLNKAASCRSSRPVRPAGFATARYSIPI